MSNDSELQFDDIILGRVLGKGLFGTVYQADYLGTEVAVKEVYRLQGIDYEKYFGREVAALREARHPNCIQFMGTTQNTHKYYIVTEYVPNGNLKKWIEERTTQLSWRQRVSFATDIARALAYLHSKGIIHRDLKGENILITDNRRVKVCDFGLSRLVAKSEDEKKRLSYCGTDSYMAPEIILCTPFDARIDIFSYGVILCELIIGKLADGHTILPRVIPGFGVNYTELERLQLSGAPPDFLQLAKRCTADLPDERPSWKDTLKILQTIEVELIKQEQEQLYQQSELKAIENGTPEAIKHIGADSDTSAHSFHDTSQPESQYVSVTELNIPEKSVNDLNLELLKFDGNNTVEQPHENINVTHTTIDNSYTPLTSPTSVLSPESPVSLDISILKIETKSVNGNQIPLPHRFSLLTPPSLTKCRVCHSRMNFHKYLVCDDCGYACHRRCAAAVPVNCQPKRGIKAHHHRYLDDAQRRLTPNESHPSPQPYSPENISRVLDGFAQ